MKPTMRRPAVTIEAARYLLAPVGEWNVFALIEDGRLSHVWNVALGKCRRELRILPASVAGYLAQRRGRTVPPVTDAAAVAYFLPAGARPAWLPIRHVWHSFNMDEQQALALARAGELDFAPGTVVKRGGHGARITTASFCRFLERRRVL
jgi:hypothetical protein